MNRGLYAACSAMLVQETNLDVVANNLANVDTVGFRRRTSANAEFSALFDRIEKVSEDGETKIMTVAPFNMNWKGKQTIGSMGLAATYSQSFMDSHPGVVRTTNNPFDVAISGEGFFAVQDGQGNTFYTRQGNFQLNADGNLVTLDGFTLQGDGGEIAVGDASQAKILSSGQVWADGEIVGQLTLFTFENPTFLQQVSKNNLQANENSGAPIAVPIEEIKLSDGAVEMSNVSVVEEMTRMIEAQRAYEAASKALTTHDETTGKLITSYSRT
ncbi:flagellar basal-body rod protein FlgF [Synergistales bacterium]|nr:flagellar basal-body rod protein FlgF [Synergistales bacterium]